MNCNAVPLQSPARISHKIRRESSEVLTSADISEHSRKFVRNAGQCRTAHTGLKRTTNFVPQRGSTMNLTIFVVNEGRTLAPVSERSRKTSMRTIAQDT